MGKGGTYVKSIRSNVTETGGDKHDLADRVYPKYMKVYNVNDTTKMIRKLDDAQEERHFLGGPLLGTRNDPHLELGGSHVGECTGH